MTNETDEELYLRLKRWGKMSAREIQKEVLLSDYVKYWTLQISAKQDAIPEWNNWPWDDNGARLNRVAEYACPNCGDHSRTPCMVTQYLETCLGCGERIGDTPLGI